MFLIKKFSRSVRAERKRQGISQRKLAAELKNVSQATLHRIEHESEPDASNFLTLCAWLGEDPNTFWSKRSR